MTKRLSFFASFGLALFALALLVAPSPARADGVRAATHDDYGRIVFDWDVPVVYTADILGGALVVQFDRPAPNGLDKVTRSLAGYVSEARVSADRRTVSFPLRGDFKLRRSNVGGNGVVLDLVGPPAGKSAAVAEKPAEPAKAPSAAPDLTPTIPVRTGIHDTFHRVVFDWKRDVGYTVDNQDGKAVIRFARPGRIDLPRLNAALPEGLKGAVTASETTGLTVTLPLPPGGSIRHFRSGGSVAFDLVKATPGAATVAAKPEATPATRPPAVQPSAPAEAKPAAKPDPNAPVALPPMPPANPPAAAVPSRPAPPSSLAPSAGGIAAVPPVAGASNQGLAPDEAALPAVGGAQELYTLSFSWDRPTAAAAFRRAGFLWVVFDRHQQADIRALQVTGGKAVSFAEQVEVGPTATAVRFVVDPAFNPSFRREGLLWIMDLQRQPLRPRTPIEVSPQPRSPVGPRLYLPVSDGGSVVTVQDPEVGDSIIVVPVLPLGAGIYPARAYPDATLPVTAQGVVVEPVSQGVSVRSSRQGVEITAAGGLRLSSDGERVAAAARLGASGGEVSAIFDIPRWRGNQEAPVFERRNQMLEAVGMAPASRRNDARMEMARFYFANGYGAEALGVLRTILAADPEFENRASFRAIRGGAEFLMGRYGDAVNDLAHPSLAGVDEAAFWRAAAQASLGNPAAQAGILEATSGVLADYPDDLRVPLALVAAEAAIAAANDLAARTFLEAANVPDVTRHQKAERLYFEGLMKETSGDFDGALQAYQQAEDEGSMKWTPHARRKRLELEHQLGRLPVDDLIQGLQRLRYAWRGDDFEFTLLRRLADLNLEKGDYGEALRGMKLVATYFDQRPEVAEITDQMLRVFEDLYLRGGADALSPITAIALYDEFRELTPAGQKGDEMIRKLADRLVKVDLLEQAAGLLDRQIQTRLKTPGEERARIGARLGLVRLLNGQPEAALNALLATGADGLSPDLAAHRSHLAARALADMGRANEAIARLDGDTTKDARILRSEIFWKAQNWPEAARTISELVPPPERGKTMAAEDARRVLDWATALTLAGDDPQAALLRRRYLDAMKDTDVFEAFDLITSPGDRGLPDYRTINEKVAQADSFRSFLSSYRDRMKTEGLSGLN